MKWFLAVLVVLSLAACEPPPDKDNPASTPDIRSVYATALTRDDELQSTAQTLMTERAIATPTEAR